MLGFESPAGGYANLLGFVGAGFTLASFLMRRMVPLRVLALVANVLLIGYALLTWDIPSLVLDAALLPINARRLWEIRRLTADVAAASTDSPVSEWLLPHMKKRTLKKGAVVFTKGDAADRLVYIAEGRLALPEVGAVIPAGELTGEIGLFAPDRKRTQTVICDTDCRLYELTDEMLFELYYQHPKIGFYIMRLIAERLLRDLQRHAPPTALA